MQRSPQKPGDAYRVHNKQGEGEDQEGWSDGKHGMIFDAVEEEVRALVTGAGDLREGGRCVTGVTAYIDSNAEQTDRR